MIVDRGVKPYKLALLRFPGDIREMMEREDVKELAKSIQDIGMLHPIIIRRHSGRSKEIIAGRHRAAACLLLKKDKVECRLVECTDTEAELITYMENAHRRHNSEERDMYIEKLVDLHVAWQQEQADTDPMEISRITGKPVRKRVSRASAHEEIAKTLGIKPATVAGYEQRAKRKRRGGRRALPGVGTLGMEVNDAFQQGCRAIQKNVSDVDYCLRKAVKYMGKVEKCKLGFPLNISDRIRGEIQETGRLLRSFSPTHLCPHCKGLGGYQENCGACQGHGWVGKGVIDNVLPELLDEDDPVILVQGVLHRVADILEIEVEEEIDEMADIWGDDI